MRTANKHFGLRIVVLTIAILAWHPRDLFCVEANAAKDRTGMYFAEKAYEAKPLPKFSEVRSQLPSPIYDDNPVFVRLYWKAWELAFHNFYEPVHTKNMIAPGKRSCRGTGYFRSRNRRIELLSSRGVHVCQSEGGSVGRVASSRAPRFDAPGRKRRIL